jgi:hypothetical protein
MPSRQRRFVLEQGALAGLPQTGRHHHWELSQCALETRRKPLPGQGGGRRGGQ